MRVEVAFVFLIVLGFILYHCVIAIRSEQSKKYSERAKSILRQRNNYVKKALPFIISCNSYPLLALVFRNLEEDVKKYNIVVNKGFKGHFNLTNSNKNSAVW